MEEANNEKVPAISEQEVMRMNYENNLLKQKLQEAYKALETLSDNRAIERLKFLFLMVKNDNGVFDAETVSKAVNEIKESMFPVEEKKDE